MSAHDWKETGERGVHCEFPTKTKGVRKLFAIYLKCARCGQDGFRKPGSKVIYTWRAD